MTKLEYYGIVGKFDELIKSYLNNRYQRVKNFCMLQIMSHLGNYLSMGSLKGQFL
jgi:hypothetical protein